MDSLTHVAMGGAIQAALLGRFQGRKALLYGAVLATLPDLDVFVPYPDPVSLMTYHRGFSHSLFVLTGLAALLAWLVRRRWPSAPYSASRLFLTLWLVLITHPLLDAMTTYGTQLFWPLPVQPASLSSIFIIDPVFTLPLLAAFLANLVWGERISRLRGGALGFAAAYLAWTLVAKTLVEQHVRTALAARGERASAMFSAPMPLNSLLWRVVARGPDDTYYETVASVFDRDEPEQLRQPLNRGLLRGLPPDQLLARLEWFTGGWLRYDAIGGDLVVTDLRMGMPGYYTFRFVMARGSPLAGWRTVLPSRWPSDRGGWAELRQILNRIVAPQPPLPLGAWASRTTQAASAQAD
ncbi:metal-dependent hydrolase [Bordetella genomosp. 11]|uniref:Hydrolase n=1 Tax=Bordetella genomosp. 11 TaxID=1416808 RepID=A0A261UNI8_9BORD|nr:metal-dependent hydrolase [Bordetella genomosp. 11]OZI63439.1 hydrolase [Bordetella genomosp. 11]